MALPLYYNWRNLIARRLSTSLTFIVVAVVVFVLALLLSFAAGIRASLVASGSPANIIVLKPGATAESTSILTPEDTARLVQTPGLARAGADAGIVPAGTPLLSPEVCVQTTIPRVRDGSVANVAVRGVDDVAFAVHPEVRLVEGRPFTQGALELIVGRNARQRFAGLELGAALPLGRQGNRMYRVVGVFEAAGGALESELWAPRTVLSDSYHRTFVSSVCLRLDSPADVPAAIACVNGASIGLEARAETTYYDDLAAKTREIVVLTTVLVVIMAIGAMFAVTNTMYSAVDARRAEIAMLRTIGFSRRAILVAFVLESLLICLTACAAGLTASLLLNGTRQDFLSDSTWTVLAYELRVTPGIIATALVTAVIVGVVGAAAPAAPAARVNNLEAVRKA